MRVLITGGNGFIGSQLAAFMRDKHDIFLVDLNFSDLTLNLFPECRVVDVTDYKGVERVVDEIKPDVICHMAARVSFRWSLREPIKDLYLHTLGTLNVLEAARRLGTSPQIIYPSTSAIFGNASVIPTPEDCPVNPTSPYGVSKLAGENYCRVYQKTYGIPTTIFRFSNVYGPLSDHGVVSIFIKRFLDNSPITLYGGDQKIQFLFVADAIEAIQTAIEKRSTGTYNLGGPDVITLKQLVGLICKLTDKRVPVDVKPPIEGDIQHIEFDISKAKKELRWTPKVGIEEGVKKCLS